ncbi:hypothetical protein QYF36_002354 [Acer negundo]|nr:hypothetical protein QYF36_002354 [Acer negundo]
MAACNQRYYNDVMEIRVDKFTRAYYPKNRYGMMSTQIAESMNLVLLDLRKLPIAAFVEHIRDMMYNVIENQNNSIVNIQAKTCGCRGGILKSYLVNMSLLVPDLIIYESLIGEKSTCLHMHRTGSYLIKSGIYLFVLGR